MKRVESKHSTITRKDIENYLNTKDENVKHNIERKALSSSFDQDALEGWDQMQSLPSSSLKKLDRHFTNRRKFYIKGVVAVLILAVASFSAWYLLANKTEKSDNQTLVTLRLEESDLQVPEGIDSLIELPTNELIHVEQVSKNFTSKRKFPDKKQNDAQKIIESSVNDLPALKLDIPEVPTIELQRGVSGKEIYLHNFKLLDYREYRSKPKVSTKVILLTGLPADQESALNENTETEWKDVEIPYIDYLDKTTAIFEKGNIKKALSRYLIILESYPNDLNALFYSGICYYNLGQYDVALQQFYLCINHDFTNFKEEAEWYLALSYEAKGEKLKANSIFELIVKNQGYYADEAKKRK